MRICPSHNVVDCNMSPPAPQEGKGFISTAELRHVLGNIGESLSPTELDDLCKEADPQGTGKIMFEEV